MNIYDSATVRWHEAMARQSQVAEVSIEDRVLQGHLEAMTKGVAVELLRDFVSEDYANLDLDRGETQVDRLIGALSGLVDRDGDGVPDDNDLDVVDDDDDTAQRMEVLDDFDELLDYLGVEESDREALLIAGDQLVGRNVQTFLRELFANDPAGMNEQLADFVFEPALPFQLTASLDAASEHKTNAASKARHFSRQWMQGRKGKTWARRFQGRITHVSKYGRAHKIAHLAKHKPWARRMTAKQRAALMKARSRAHTGAALAMNRRSNSRTRRLGGRRVS